RSKAPGEANWRETQTTRRREDEARQPGLRRQGARRSGASSARSSHGPGEPDSRHGRKPEEPGIRLSTAAEHHVPPVARLVVAIALQCFVVIAASAVVRVVDTNGLATRLAIARAVGPHPGNH